MKLNEVLTMGGASQFVRPGTMVSQQVVQPRTIQADEPQQSGQEYENAKNKQKEWHRIEVDIYNNKDIDTIKNPYDDPEELSKKLNKTIFAINNEPISSMDLDYVDFADKVDSETDDE
jgi:hypothetical protein